jgi:hypothetical protein
LSELPLQAGLARAALAATHANYIFDVTDRTDKRFFVLAKFLYRQLSDTGVWRLRV